MMVLRVAIRVMVVLVILMMMKGLMMYIWFMNKVDLDIKLCDQICIGMLIILNICYSTHFSDFVV